LTVLENRHIEDCFDGSIIKEFLLDKPMTEPFIRHLGTLGVFQYFPSFARPFFTVISENQFKIKGVEGNDNLRIIFYENNRDTLNEFVCTHIGNYID